MLLLVNVVPVFCYDYRPASSVHAKNAIGSCTTDISGHLALTYFDTAGKAELSRLILKSGEYDYIDTRLKYDNLQQKRNDPNSAASRIFEQLPILERGDNFKLDNSRAIAAHVADLAIPSTRNTDQKRAIDTKILDSCGILQKELYKCYYGSEISKTEAKRKIDQTIRPTLLELERQIPYTGYIKGGIRPSAADLAIFDVYSSPCPGLVNLNCDLSLYPKLVALAKRVREYPTVKAYLKVRGY